VTTEQVIEWLYRHRRVDYATGCWEYTDDTTNDGRYGRTGRAADVAKWAGTTLVHRIAMKAFTGWEPRSGRLSWECGNTLCFNYEHLRRGTSKSGYADCARCGQRKPLSADSFPRLAARASGYHSWCKECWRAYYREHRQAWLELGRRYKQSHPEIRRESGHRRRARERGARVGKVSLKRILLRDDWTCHLCGDKIEGFSDLHFDHIIPLSKGGEHSENNIALSHAVCNMRKHTSVVPSRLQQLRLAMEVAK
jgi:5-methylcytosine-specific restriction endonuclease McrA